jgi:hypothetical protein
MSGIDLGAAGLASRSAVDDSLPLGDALARHYTEHGLPTDGGESQTWFRISVGPLRIPLPNPPARRRAVFFHDANHVLTGYNTGFSDGEMVIAGFEIGAGCGRFWIAWCINLVMFAFGLVVRPRDVFRAFVDGLDTISIYGQTSERLALTRQSVRDVRAALGLDRAGRPPTARDRISFAGWSAVAVLVTVAGAGVPAVAVVWAAALAIRVVV